MKKCLKVLSRNALICGIIIIAIIIAEINVYEKDSTKGSIQVSNTNSKMQRSSTNMGFTNPLDAAEYVLNAYLEKDIDKALRGCAIYERAVNVQSKAIIDEEGYFSMDNSWPDSANHREYFPMTQTRLMKEYCDNYDVISHFIGDSESVQIISVDYYKPNIQSQGDSMSNMYYECEYWKAKKMLDVVSLIEVNQELYVIPCRMVYYESNWKLFSHELITDDVYNITNHKAIDKSNYENIVGNKKEIKTLKKKFGIKKRQESVEEEILPLNYQIYDTRFEATPEELIKQFCYSLKKKDTSKAISYGNYMEVTEDNLEECIEEQRQFSEQLLKLYYHLANRGLDEEIDLKNTGMTGSKIISKLSPENMHLITYGGCDEVTYIDENTREYVYYLKIGKKWYSSGCVLEKTNIGWSIAGLSAEKFGYMVAELRI